MATRTLVRKSTGNAARTARRARKPRAGTPKLTRVTKSLDLTAPPGFIASAILRRADKARQVYSLWVLAGRHERARVTIRYAFDGVEAIRCDIPPSDPSDPSANFLSATALEPYLREFLEAERAGTREPSFGVTLNEGDPPVIKH